MSGNYDWREQPASEKQRRALDRLGITHPAQITSGEASDLITATEPADDYQLEILRFFKVRAKGMNALEARREVTRLLADKGNAARWKARPADREQIDALTFFGRDTRGLSHSAAKAILDELTEDDAAGDALAEHEAALDDERAWWDSTREELNQYAREDYGCLKLKKALFRRAVEALVEEGVGRDAINSDRAGRLFTKAAELDPSIVRDRALLEDRTHFEAGYVPDPTTPYIAAPVPPRTRFDPVPWIALAVFGGLVTYALVGR